MEELRNYLLNLNITKSSEEFINNSSDKLLSYLFDIEEIESQGDFGNAKALYVEFIIDTYKTIE